MAALRSPWSKWALAGRSSIFNISGPVVPFWRLRFTCRKKSSKVLVRSKVDGLSGVIAFRTDFFSGSSHPATQWLLPNRQSRSSRDTRNSAIASLMLLANWCAASVLSSAVWKGIDVTRSIL